MKNWSSPSKKGFTLIELLVVISIIALLLSILMPALRKVKEKATALLCMTRLKDLGLAVNLYTADNRRFPSNHFPGWYDDKILAAHQESDLRPWFANLGDYYARGNKNDETPYAGNDDNSWGWMDFELLRCPTLDKYTTNRVKKGALNDRGELVGWEGIYGYNMFMSEPPLSGMGLAWNQFAQNNPSSFKLPSNIPLLADVAISDPFNIGDIPGGVRMTFGNPHSSAYKYGWQDGNVRSRRHNYTGVAPNHDSRCSFLFVDGHTERRDVCKAEAWPWLGDTPKQQQSGRAFDPRRKGYNFGL